MPRSVQDIIDHADEYADRFERYEPKSDDELPAAAIVELHDAMLARAAAERRVRAAVHTARRSRTSWANIGKTLGTTGEAARQRYADVESGS